MLSIEKVSMVYELVTDLFEHLVSLPVLEDHSFHLSIEFVIDLFLHLMVHCLHELLKNVLQVLDIHTLTHLLFKGFIDAHDVWGF